MTRCKINESLILPCLQSERHTHTHQHTHTPTHMQNHDKDVFLLIRASLSSGSAATGQISWGWKEVPFHLPSSLLFISFFSSRSFKSFVRFYPQSLPFSCPHVAPPPSSVFSSLSASAGFLHHPASIRKPRAVEREYLRRNMSLFPFVWSLSSFGSSPAGPSAQQWLKHLQTPVVSIKLNRMPREQEGESFFIYCPLGYFISSSNVTTNLPKGSFPESPFQHNRFVEALEGRWGGVILCWAAETTEWTAFRGEEVSRCITFFVFALFRPLHRIRDLERPRSCRAEWLLMRGAQRICMWNTAKYIKCHKIHKPIRQNFKSYMFNTVLVAW